MSRVIPAFAQFFDGTGAPLANGWLRFLISGTTDTDKNTYADVDQTIPNANPVQLDGEGRAPNIFGQGIYKVVLYDVNPVTGQPGVMIQTFDPVVADYLSEGAGGNFAEYDAATLYQIGQIVIYNGLYYRSHIANNLGNQPDISAAAWEQIDFLRFWNLDVTYGVDNVVIYGSNLYFSLQAGNLNHTPGTSPTWWDPVGSGTILLNWMESGTNFIPNVDGYNIGDATHRPGTVYIKDAPTADDQGANKGYVDGRGTCLTDWEDTGATLRPKADDSEGLGDATHRAANVWIANDPTNDNHAVRRAYLDSRLYVANGSQDVLINGNLDFFQYGSSITGPLGVTFLADRFVCSDGADGNASISKQTFTPGQTDVPEEPTNYLRFVQTVAATSGIPSIFQRVEGVRTLAGQVSIFVFYARVLSGTLSIVPEFRQVFGTGGSPSSTIIMTGSPLIVTTTWQRFEWVLTVPSIASKTIGTNDDDFIHIGFQMPLAITYTIDVAKFKFGSGNIDFPYANRTKGVELQLCQRYFEKSYNTQTPAGSIGAPGRQISYISNLALAVNDYVFSVDFKTAKRAIPSVTPYSYNNGAPGVIDVSSGTITPVIVPATNAFEVQANITVATSLRYYGLHFTADAEL